MKGLSMLMACVVLSVCAASALAEMTYKEAYDQAQATYRKRDWVGARDALVAAAALAPTDKDRAALLLQAGTSETYRGKERDLPAARALFEQVLAVKGALPAQTASARYQIGTAYYNENKIDEARKTLEALAAEEGADPASRASARCQVAVICSDKDKNYEQAIAEYQKVFEIKGAQPANYSAAQVGIGGVLTTQKKHDEAMAAYDKLATMDKAHPTHIAQAALQQGHIQRTLKNFEKAREKYALVIAQKDAPQIYVQYGHYFTALSWMEQGDKPKAREAFMAFLNLKDIPESLRNNTQKFMAAMNKEAK